MLGMLYAQSAWSVRRLNVCYRYIQKSYIQDAYMSLFCFHWQKPKSSQVYNQIGNYWRIKGDTTRSVECFRKSLFLAPNNSDALLNLARVLFNLQYLDDAYELTRASLDAQPPDQNAWLQHFTLGEILKARMQYHDAGEHFRRTLDLHPGFHPAQVSRSMSLSTQYYRQSWVFCVRDQRKFVLWCIFE